ncbi:hypothetical protein ACKI1J_49085 [Streptomyces scabiei]|uniref:hypothetical protein n=1 Tax=Streptomyces scabiei TaxID=1930 RepID=UPI0039EEDBE8
MRGAEDDGPADRAGAEAGMRARHGEGDGRDAGPRPAPGTEALLAAALRGERAGAEGERRAVAAFRAAREAEPARAARTRRRDDWRPRDGRHPGRTLKTALSVLLASLTLGGVAYAAAMGGGGDAADDGGPRRDRPPAPAESASVQPVATPRAATPGPATTRPGAAAPPDRPAAAGDTEAHCRAYERLEGRGGALDATAWRRLVTAAGGAEHVEAYCAHLPAATETGRGPSNADGNAEGGNAEGGNATGGNGAAGNAAAPDNGAGNGAEGNGNQENGGKGSGGGGGNAEGQVSGRDR